MAAWNPALCCGSPQRATFSHRHLFGVVRFEAMARGSPHHPLAPTEVQAAFDAAASDYDRARRQLVPCFDDFYQTVVEQLPFARGDAPRILDLGAGTGLLAAWIFAAHPAADITLVDVAGAMLAQARKRLSRAAEEGRAHFSTLDLAQAEFSGSWDAVVSALAIHHLDAAAKQHLFVRIHQALRPGGVFLNADQVRGATPRLEQIYAAAWLEQVRQRGVSAADLTAAQERMEFDRTDPLEDQLIWLRDAGFRDVGCFFQHYRFAVFGGFKAEASAAGPASPRNRDHA
ncbi:MAG TPA: methyltransferase domain-containing protein [Myxococcota bacterium]|nr:methyltransferase domain-containing protein [Myxococcota bacterium]